MGPLRLGEEAVLGPQSQLALSATFGFLLLTKLGLGNGLMLLAQIQFLDRLSHNPYWVPSSTS